MVQILAGKPFGRLLSQRGTQDVRRELRDPQTEPHFLGEIENFVAADPVTKLTPSSITPRSEKPGR